MSHRTYRGVEQARNQLPQLLEQAAGGSATVVAGHGKAIAAIVPLDADGEGRQQSILPLAGTGRGLWGAKSTATVRKLRDEWNR